ncbi:ADP-ribosylglycohydrolase family protein [Auraticoccus cholistanensis]|nr:ADP-ribosylglycohydrolase family protein [Auraticoccus cholistanensis]
MAGVLVGQACGDALGVPYEFGSRALGEHPTMLGGGLGAYAPGEFSDDTQMAVCIAQVAATGADLTSDAALDEVATAFLEWQRLGATDIGNQTARVLGAALRTEGPVGRRMTEAARRDLAVHPRGGAGNGALMRTAVVGLTRLDDRRLTADAAAAVAALTHPDPDAVASCVLWSEAVRRAVVDRELDVHSGLDLLPVGQRDRWRALLDEATQEQPSRFLRNGWTVTALQAAWSSIVHTPVPAEEPAAGSFGCLHLQHVLETAIRIGHDTDTVAAIAGGLLGAYWGVSAVPARWRRKVHGWPGVRVRDLVTLSVLTGVGGRPDSAGWPGVARMPYAEPGWTAVPHPDDAGVLLGTVGDLGQAGDAVVSLCRLGFHQVPAAGVREEDHVEVWLLDSDDPADNPHLDFVLADTASVVADLRAEGRTVLVHCVAAEQRTPAVAVAYARRLGRSAQEAQAAVAQALPSTRSSGRLWERAASVSL